ncbi:ATP-binding cassette domain-containing protein [Rheinheimera sp.]|uniref:amino acid ABC transporter ATP-binding/permease protein n=1 Tax=Rheinheimera sp. TaxID=1869214 RepID=UPI00307F7A7C
MLKPESPLKLGSLLAAEPKFWALALMAGLLSTLAAFGLMTVSGWFLSACALAGLQLANAGGFNYFSPAALIRLSALTRTAGRYGERLLSHQAVLTVLHQLRLWFMQKFLSTARPCQRQQSANLLNTLLRDIDRLDMWPLRFLLPIGWAVLISLCWLALVACWFPTVLPWFGTALILLYLLLGLLNSLAFSSARQLEHLDQQRRPGLLNPLQQTPLLQLHGQSLTSCCLRLEQRYQQQLYRQKLCDLLLQVALSSGFLCAAATLLLQQQLTRDDLPALVGCLLGLFVLLELHLPLLTLYQSLAQAKAALSRLNQQQYQPAVPPLPLSVHQLRWRQLSAGYPGSAHSVRCRDIDLAPGDCLWLQGRSGSGKSALLYTLSGWLPALSGQIWLNQHQVKPEHAPALRQLIVLVPQHVTLFNQSLAANLRLGNPNATAEQMTTLLYRLGLAEWFSQLPNGLHTLMGEYGTSVSGGQAKRLALARALLQQPKVLLVDEPYTGLDAESVRAVEACLDKFNGILLIASHQKPQGEKTLSIVNLTN